MDILKGILVLILSLWWLALTVAADIAFNILWADWMRSHPGNMAYSLVRYFGQFFFVIPKNLDNIECAQIKPPENKSQMSRSAY